MDRIINVSVGGNYLKKDKKSAGVRGEANVTRLRITFDKGWDNYAKKVTFLDARGLNPVNVTLGVNLLEYITNDERVYLVPIPAEPMAVSGELTFIIEGALDNKIQKSFADTLEVKDAPDTAGAVNAVDPTPSEVAQLQAQIEFIKNTFGKTSYIGEDGTVNVWNARSGAYVPIEALKGEDGKSAYELAKEGGYTGTEAEFIAMLNGLSSLVNGEHYKDINNPHKVTASQVGSLKIYKSFDDLNKELGTNFDSDTPIETIIGAMPDNTGLKADINTHDAGHSGTTIYPVVYGILSIYKIRSNRVEVEYVSNTAAGGIEHNKRWIGQYNSGVFGGFVQVYTEQHKPTAEDVGALPIAGGTITGTVLRLGNGLGQVVCGSTYSSIDAIGNGGKNARLLRVINPDLTSYALSKAAQLCEIKDGKATEYNLFGEHNINDFVVSKGSYAGAGTTSKTIPIRKTTQMVIVYGMQVNAPYTLGILVRGQNAAHCDIGPSVSNNTTCDVVWSDTSVTVSNTLSQPIYAWNVNGVNYNYVVIG